MEDSLSLRINFLGRILFIEFTRRLTNFQGRLQVTTLSQVLIGGLRGLIKENPHS